MIETLIFMIILMFLNLILIFRPVPILSFTIGIFTIWVSAIEFLPDILIPKWFVYLLGLISAVGMIINVWDMKK